MANQKVHALLAEAIGQKGFKRRGNAFSRVVGDGILQTIKFEWEPRPGFHELSIGVRPLYSTMNPYELSPGGCVLRYCASNFRGLKSAHECWIEGNMLFTKTHSPEDQLHYLLCDGLRWMGSMETQRDYLEHVFDLERSVYGEPQWNYEDKMTAALICKDWELAEKVISAIFRPYFTEKLLSEDNLTEADFESLRVRLSGRDTYLLQIHDWIRACDYEAIDKYLKEQFKENTKNCRLL